MPAEWIKALSTLEASNTPAIMITVVDERGSTPRNAGAKMLVSAEQQFDTIGGGHLEYKAIKIARTMLTEKHKQPRLERFSLGASLGQCCGGATTLLLEPIGIDNINIAIFGAGHIGRALVPILAGLPCTVHWIDSREQEFPEHIPEGVKKYVSEFPVDEVAELPANSYYLVMTHNHQLDQQLSEAILKRNDHTYFGLIGSATKRKKFEHRLQAKGFSEEQMLSMTCPIGIPEVKGKLPAEIAVAIAGEIIAYYNAEFGSKQQTPPQDTKIIERLAI